MGAVNAGKQNEFAPLRMDLPANGFALRSVVCHFDVE